MIPSPLTLPSPSMGERESWFPRAVLSPDGGEGFSDPVIPSPSKEDTQVSIQRIQPGKRLSAAVVHGDTIYLAGQIAGDAATDVKGQTQQILKKIDDLLAAAGSSKSKLLSATIWLADMRYFDDMNSVWDAWMDPANPPARATVEARLAAPKYFVEIAGVAAK